MLFNKVKQCNQINPKILLLRIKRRCTVINYRNSVDMVCFEKDFVKINIFQNKNILKIPQTRMRAVYFV